MGIYLNPGDSGFRSMLASEYVDKTGLIFLVNESIGTTYKLTCVSRPRRFGKSYAAKMLCAYYDKTCNGENLFDGLAIADDSRYLKHLHKYDVIYLDMTNLLGKAEAENLTKYIESNVAAEILTGYPEIKAGNSFDQTLANCVEYTGNKFIMIIDEWDAPIRETPTMERKYLEFLRMLFKSSGTTDKIFAAAYMTGILPIRKDGSQSAISDFEEYTMLDPQRFADFVGFTENDVKTLCEKHKVKFADMKRWYDGYNLGNIESVYNPNSVMKAIQRGKFKSYWTETSAATSLMHYISQDYHGLTKTIAELIGGIDVAIDPYGFANNLTTFRGKDDVLTLLVHLGYLSFDEEAETVRIPNEEIRREFSRAIREVKHTATLERLQESKLLFQNTIEGKADEVAKQIEKVHGEETSSMHYNNEASLRSVIKLAYYTYKDNYLKFEELPGGAGYADIVYFPKKNSPWPILVIELKWNKSVETALDQIRQRNYSADIKDYGSEILLVGINYDKDDPPGQRRHECKIERMNQ